MISEGSSGSCEGRKEPWCPTCEPAILTVSRPGQACRGRSEKGSLWLGLNSVQAQIHKPIVPGLGHGVGGHLRERQQHWCDCGQGLGNEPPRARMWPLPPEMGV